MNNNKYSTQLENCQVFSNASVKSENNSGLCLDLTTRLYGDRGGPEGFPLSPVKVISLFDVLPEGNPVYQDAPGHDDSYQVDQIDHFNQAQFHRHTSEEVKQIIKETEEREHRERRAYFKTIDTKERLVWKYAELEIYERTLRQMTWIEWIATQQWDWFGTLTYQEDYIPDFVSDKHFYRWLRTINRKRFGVIAKHKNISVSWVRGKERQERGSTHFHCLINNVDKLMRNEMGKAWWKITGGYGKILPSAGMTAIKYIAKYVSKSGQLDVDIRDLNGNKLNYYCGR